MKRRSRILLWLSFGVFVLGAVGYGYWRYHYPFGMSHCCDLGVYFALLSYAESHEGRFPFGQSSPEASLGLLYREQLLDAYTLRGKTVPEAIVRERLESGQLLTPETCGWHYVEGLRRTDSPEIALLWDKVGLDHNGGSLPGGGHIVLFVGSVRRHIRASEWQAFLSSQQQLLAARSHEP